MPMKSSKVQYGIDKDIVWDIIENKLPVLEKQVKKILSE